MFDAFDFFSSAKRLTNEPWNGDVWEFSDPTGVYYETLEFAPAGYIANNDEPVDLPGQAWQTWVHKWLDRGNRITIENVIGGLVDTMEEWGANWCQRCEVLAVHSSATPDWVRQADPSQAIVPPGGGLLGNQGHYLRWAACADDSDMHGLLGDPPEPYLNVNAYCNPCPPLHYADYGGDCAPCPAGQVPRGAVCEPCPPGSVPTAENECSGCGPGEISYGGDCIPCPPGQGADHASNTCVDCPPDAVVDWATIPEACDEYVELVVVPDSTGAGGADACPGQFWVEVQNLGEAVARGSLGILASTEPFDNAITQQECVGAEAAVSWYTHNGAQWVLLANDYSPAGTWGEMCGEMGCAFTCSDFAAAAQLETTAITSAPGVIRVHANTQILGQPVNGNLSLTSDVWYPWCDLQ